MQPMNNLARDLEWMAPFTLLQARDLQMSVETLGGFSTGEARITGGHNLEAKHIIHIVGPIWEDGHENEPQLLENCFKNSLRLASENGIRTIAFPAISTGAYDFPPDQASLAFYEKMTISQSTALHD